MMPGQLRISKDYSTPVIRTAVTQAFLRLFRWGQFSGPIGLPGRLARQSRRGDGGSNPVKLLQTDAPGQAGGQIVCEYFTMNDLQYDS